MTQRGFFITIEGMDGSGKSTILTRLAEHYQNDPRFQGVQMTREPGGTPLAEMIRNLIFLPNVEPELEALLFAAARVDHVQKLLQPSILAGKLIISDRYIDSSYVYQGRFFSLAKIQAVNAWALEQCMPNLTVILDLPTQVAYERIHSSEPLNREVNRLDAEPWAFHVEIAQRYRQLPKWFPDRNIQVVDVNCAPQVAYERVLGVCEDAIQRWLNER